MDPAEAPAPALHLLGLPTVFVSLGEAYNRCVPGALLDAPLSCDPGAMANDDVDGDITHLIQACASEGSSEVGENLIAVLFLPCRFVLLFWGVLCSRFSA